MYAFRMLEPQPTAVIRLVIADDHILIRAGLRRLIESLGGIEVVGEATGCRETLELVAQVQPHALLLDISLPDGSGLDVLKTLHSQHPELKVLMLSMHSDLQHVRAALAAGASGFLVKDSAPGELELALRTVMRGESYLSTKVAGGVVHALLQEQQGQQHSVGGLSPRQREILRLISQGFGTKEIATQLDLSVKTVETHRARMMEALGLRRGSELLRYALSHAGDLI